MKFGVRFLVDNRELRTIVIVTSLIGFFYNMASSTSVLFMLEELQVKESQFGILMTIIGSAGLLGSWLTPKLSARFGRGRVMAVAIATASAMFGLEGASPNYLVYVALGWLGVLTISAWNPLLMACYQVLIPRHLYGRVHGARRTLVWGLGPFGAVIGGLIANFGLRWPYLVGGVASVALALAYFGFIRRLGDRAAAVGS